MTNSASIHDVFHIETALMQGRVMQIDMTAQFKVD